MKTIKIALLAAAAAMIATVPAFAADMALKGQPPASTFAINGSGWYVGLGVEGIVGASQVSGTNFPALTSANLTADGGSLGIDVGRIWSNCLLSSWCQLELDGKWQNVSGNSVGGSVNSQWSVSAEFDVGIEAAATILSAVNLGQSFPTFDPSGLLPANLSGKISASPRQYLGGVVEAMKIGGSFGAASGETWAVAGGPKTGYRWQTLNASGAPNGGSINVYAEILFANRGVTFSNVFAAGGAPVTVNASASMNTIYAAGVHYDFGIPSR